MSDVYEHWDRYGHRLQVNTIERDEVWFEITESATANRIYCASVPKSMIPDLIRLLEAS